jgi:fatty-acyl-CoA synthase
MSPSATNVLDDPAPARSRRASIERLTHLAGALRPLALYQRTEALGAVFAATSPSLAEPLGLLRAGPSMRRWRGNPAGIVVAGARQHPDLAAIVDDLEVVTSIELERRTNALARRIVELGVGPGQALGILAGNRAMVIEAGMAAYKVGADTVYLNSGFSPTQAAEVVAREGIDLVIADDEHAAAITAITPVLSQADLQEVFRGGDGSPLSPPAAPGSIVVLTSGTTGTPKGARRSKTGSALDAAGILACIPFTAGDTTLVAAPIFHGLGLFNANLALALGSPVILRERFDARRVLADISRHQVAVLIAVPAMLHRIMSLPRRELDQFDTSSLKIVVSGGAALAGDLAGSFMDRFGEILYNVYGSTETALATIASPRDLRRAPGTAGRPTPGVRVRVLDEAGGRVPPGATGRVFVGSHLGFDGYTGGGGKDSVDGLLFTGDLGRLDRWGRLFLEGRADEMIVSGGENVFPAEVEEALLAHPAVAEAAVLGVDDPEFGQRLAAFVVLRTGRRADEELLKQHVRDRLARFKIPREITFLDSFPKTATGKVMKRLLGEPDRAASKGPGL